jgi:hypothetical protein
VGGRRLGVQKSEVRTSPGVKRATQTSFIKEIYRACPGAMVDLGFLADLDTLSQASIDTQEIS